MATSLSLTLRPVRLAVLADCRSAEGLLRAIEATTMQWGGSANPLVPYFDEYPAALSEGFDKINSFERAFEVIARYHDPDRVLRVVDAQQSFPIKTVELEHVLKVDPDIIWDTNVGVSLLEIARLFDYQQLRFKPRDQIRIAYVDGGEDLKLSSAILYGALPSNLRDEFLASLGSTVAPTKINASDFYSPFFDGYVTPRTVGQYNLSFSNSLVVGCTHESEPLDALTLWNAAVDYRHVIPLPTGLALSAELLERLVRHCAHERLTDVLIIRCPSVADAELKAVFRAFRDANVGFTWQDHSRTAPTKFERRASVHGTASRALRTVEERDERLHVELLAPRLLNRDSLRYGDPRYVNEATIKTQDRRRLPAEVLPAKLKRFWKDPFPPLTNFRVADTGLCLFANRIEEDESIPLPDATAIIRGYLENRGFQTSVSPQGLAFQQLLVLTNGAISSFDHPKMRKLLQLFDGPAERDSVPAGANRPVTWPDIQRVIPEHPEYSLRLLLSARLVEVGMLLQCENCGGREFYTFSDIALSTRCKRCQLDFAPPLDNPRRMDTWAYRLLPPFDDQKARRGLLGMTFAFSVLDDSPGDKTIAAGIQLVHPDRPDVEIEVDFIALQKSNYELPEVVPLFLEAKYGQTFTRLDVARMAFLLRWFPYGVFGFSTTRASSEIDPHILRRLRRFAQLRQGRREATHSTMLLTERELRASFEAIEDHDHIIGSFREIAYKTKERHLGAGTPSYVSWRTTKEEAARGKRELSSAKLAAKARAMSADPEA